LLNAGRLSRIFAAERAQLNCATTFCLPCFISCGRLRGFASNGLCSVIKFDIDQGAVMEIPGTHIASIAQVIQLSVAPVFLLAGVGAILNVLVGRLVRIVDRARATENQMKNADEATLIELHERLEVLGKRARLISRAITLSVLCAVLVPIVIVSLFVSVLFGVNLAVPIAVAFIIGLVTLAAGLVYFLREVFVATAALSIGVAEGKQSDSQRFRRVVRNS
jgi:Protein of unknown function (DUF2721)